MSRQLIEAEPGEKLVVTFAYRNKMVTRFSCKIFSITKTLDGDISNVAWSGGDSDAPIYIRLADVIEVNVKRQPA